MATEKTAYVEKTSYAENSEIKECAAGFALAFGGGIAVSTTALYVAANATNRFEYEFGVGLGAVGTAACALGGFGLIIDAEYKYEKKEQSDKYIAPGAD